MEINDGKLNLTSSCNMDCHCSGIPYSPVCYEETGDTFFNPCVASCKAYSKQEKVLFIIFIHKLHLYLFSLYQFYSECNCAQEYKVKTTVTTSLPSTVPLKSATTSNLVSSTLSLQSTNSLTSTTLNDIKIPTTLISSTVVINANADSAESLLISDSEKILASKPEKLLEQSDDGNSKRKRRSDDNGEEWVKLIPGACVKGCAFGFYAFSLMSSLINCFGASGRIGNLLGEIFC